MLAKFPLSLGYCWKTVGINPTSLRLANSAKASLVNGLNLDYTKSNRGVAQPGSALAWGARGPGFESRHPDQYIQKGTVIV